MSYVDVTLNHLFISYVYELIWGIIVVWWIDLQVLDDNIFLTIFEIRFQIHNILIDLENNI